MKKLTQICFAGMLVTSLVGCYSNSSVSTVVSAGSYTKYVPAVAHSKQGAAVSLVNSKVNLAASGVQYSIDFGINSRYSSGTMDVAFSSSDGLYIVSGDTNIEQSLTKGEITFPFEVTATENGHYYVHAIVTVESKGIKSNRALSLIVEVGEQEGSDINKLEKTTGINIQDEAILIPQNTGQLSIDTSKAYQANEEIIKSE